jgi:NlpC/P60 family putative phage cell wall peptidase
MRARVLEEAGRWIGTPYRHQGSTLSVGCDCLGLVRGVWRALYGEDPFDGRAYAPDWAEATGEDRLLEAAQKHMRPVSAGEAAPGDLLLFRWRPHLPAKHLAILAGDEWIIHAYQRHAVARSPLAPAWKRRIAARFAFPDAG